MTSIERSVVEPVSLRTAFLRLWALGLPGGVALASEPMAETLLSAAGLSEYVLRAANFALMSLVLAGLVGIGVIASAHVGLLARIAPQIPQAQWPKGHAFHWIQAGVLAGAAAAAGQALFDLWYWSLPDQETLFVLQEAAKQSAHGATTRLLYGAVTEELMLRFGLMSGVLWVLVLLYPPGGLRQMRRLAWSAIVATAALIVVGQLPAILNLVATTSGVADPTVFLLARTLVVTGAVSILYGWLFWRHGLEAAILAHLIATGGLILFEGLALI